MPAVVPSSLQSGDPSDEEALLSVGTWNPWSAWRIGRGYGPLAIAAHMPGEFVTRAEQLCDLPILCSTEPIRIAVGREPELHQLFPKQTAGPCRFAEDSQVSFLADVATSVAMTRAPVMASLFPTSQTVGGTT